MNYESSYIIIKIGAKEEILKELRTLMIDSDVYYWYYWRWKH